MGPSDERWLDEEAGPLVRPYAMTRGRTRHTRADFDLIAIIACTDATPDERAALGPEHEAILEVTRQPLSVAEISSYVDLPLGVVRVLLGDLLDQELITVRKPAPVTDLPGERVLKEVIDGIQGL
ncbi:MAG: DUF742 domain-containing protein [Streptosporangiales bacterium]|nr:DUF742 domain-containing protein [Streptosporangiales bacterium]